MKHAQRGGKVDRITYFVKQKHHKVSKANQLKQSKPKGAVVDNKIDRRNSVDDSLVRPKDKKGYLKFKDSKELGKSKKRKGI